MGRDRIELDGVELALVAAHEDRDEDAVCCLRDYFGGRAMGPRLREVVAEDFRGLALLSGLLAAHLAHERAGPTPADDGTVIMTPVPDGTTDAVARLKLIAGVNIKAMAFSDTYEGEDGFGADLAYLFGTIASGDTCEFEDDRTILRFLRHSYFASDPVWKYVEVVPANTE